MDEEMRGMGGGEGEGGVPSWGLLLVNRGSTLAPTPPRVSLPIARLIVLLIILLHSPSSSRRLIIVRLPPMPFLLVCVLLTFPSCSRCPLQMARPGAARGGGEGKGGWGGGVSVPYIGSAWRVLTRRA